MPFTHLLSFLYMPHLLTPTLDTSVTIALPSVWSDLSGNPCPAPSSPLWTHASWSPPSMAFRLAWLFLCLSHRLPNCLCLSSVSPGFLFPSYSLGKIRDVYRFFNTTTLERCDLSLLLE